MTCRPPLFWLRPAATILVVTGLVAAGQARAAMPFSDALMAVEICHEETVTTVWLDAQGNEHPAPQDCRDCGLRAPPILPEPTADAGQPCIPAAVRMRANHAPALTAPESGPAFAHGPPPLQSRIVCA